MWIDFDSEFFDISQISDVITRAMSFRWNLVPFQHQFSSAFLFLRKYINFCNYFMVPTFFFLDFSSACAFISARFLSSKSSITESLLYNFPSSSNTGLSSGLPVTELKYFFYIRMNARGTYQCDQRVEVPAPCSLKGASARLSFRFNFTISFRTLTKTSPSLPISTSCLKILVSLARKVEMNFMNGSKSGSFLLQ